MNCKYKVPIIPPNLSKYETIIQIAEVLDHLSNITENIVSHLDKKITKTENQLSLISQRINKVNGKINELKGTKTAIQVFSSSKYPATEVHRDYISVFHDCPEVNIIKYPIKIRSDYSTHEPLEKLQFYHVNVPSGSRDKKLEGLGEIPQNINYINDLHLYNSGKNVYTNFSITNILKGQQSFQENESIENLTEIGAPPHSISERLNLSRSFTKDYFYAPQIGDVPALDVPLDLPDLPGIADNLHYETNFDGGIAPSSTITTPLLEDINKLPVAKSIEVEKLEISVDINLPQLPSAVELPEPPIILEKSIPQEKIVEIQVDEKPVAPKDIKLPEAEVPKSNDLRKSLMEAIRNAGGKDKAKLKSIQQKKEEMAKTPQTGDLMADLHNKLFMRRKGISGDKKPSENVIDASSTLGKISAMIPAPEPNTAGESTSNDEEDWE